LTREHLYNESFSESKGEGWELKKTQI